MRKEMEAMTAERVTAFLEDLKHSQNRRSRELRVEVAVTDDPVPFSQRRQLEYRDITVGEAWGQAWQNGWFRLHGEIPGELDGQELVLLLDFDGEALLYDKTGQALGSISTGSCLAQDSHRCRQPLGAVSGALEFWADAVAGSLWGWPLDPRPVPGAPPENHTARLLRAQIAAVEPETGALLTEMDFLFRLYRSFPPATMRARRLLRILNEAIVRYDYRPENAGAARTALAGALALASDSGELTFVCFGHSHLDTAWLWRYRECRRKAERIFVNQLALLQADPEYRFGASQALHYRLIQEHNPALFEQIRRQVQAGHWELLGGTWVENDLNLPGLEALIRQIVHGKAYFQREFGVEPVTAWYPDCFGFPAVMPQLLRRSNLTGFFTVKLAGNQHNQMPHHTFWWEGVDGSRILTHLSPCPEGTNCLLQPEVLTATREAFRENDFLEELLLPFGIGDGGGGPRENELARLRLGADLGGLPRLRSGSVREFFNRLETRHGGELATWHGELYYERHRGCHTTWARTKAENLALENRLRELEFLSVMAGNGRQERFDAIWKTLLLNQFHDILPGSAIAEVFDDAVAAYAEAQMHCDTLERELIEELFDTADGVETVFNFHSFAIVHREYTAPPLSLQSFPAATPPGATVMLEQDAVLENELIRYRFDQCGQLQSAWDKETQRELLQAPGNRFTLRSDVSGGNYDAWDLDWHSETMPTPESRMHTPSRRERRGNIEILHTDIEIGATVIRQQIQLEPGTRLLAFETEIPDWQERHRVLQVEFHPDVRAETAAYGVQGAFVRRPTRRNTGWELAQFENVFHGFVDLSDADGGAALLAQDKYGANVLGNRMRLTLLRSSCFPDRNADRGAHRFRYGFYPHFGDAATSDVIETAASFKHPPRVLPRLRLKPGIAFPVALSGDGVSLECVKWADDGDGLILRLVEKHGRNATAQLRLPVYAAEFIECDLTERRLEAATPVRPDGSVEVKLTGFAIRTFRLRL